MARQVPKKVTGSDAETQAEYRLAAAWLKQVADVTRIGVMLLIVDGEQPVGILCANLGTTMSALSRHLTRLRLSGLVQTRRQGQQMFYSLTVNGRHLLRIVEVMGD